MDILPLCHYTSHTTKHSIVEREREREDYEVVEEGGGGGRREEEVGGRGGGGGGGGGGRGKGRVPQSWS